MFDEPIKPYWVDSTDNGKIKCNHCSYRTNLQDNLTLHDSAYHKSKKYILYLECDCNDTTFKDKQDLIINIEGFEWIETAGLRSAFRDGDIEAFEKEVIKTSIKTGAKYIRILRILDPGIGLMVAEWWLNGGLKAGEFTSIYSSIYCKE